MNNTDYGYSAQPTRNPVRFGLALWRLISREISDASTADAAVVEIGFARSRLGRRFSRWNDTVDYLRREPVTAAAIDRREVMGPINLRELQQMPVGSPAFFAFMVAVLLLKVVFRKEDARPLFDAFVDGYKSGQTAEPLFGTSWGDLWQEPLADVRRRFEVQPVVADLEVASVAA